jgi:hypothetical protein
VLWFDWMVIWERVHVHGMAYSIQIYDIEDMKLCIDLMRV